MRFVILSFLLLGLFSSCSKSDCDEGFTETKFKVNKEYCLKDNESITIKNVQDSRCPSDVICVWEGEVNLSLSLKKESGNVDFDLVFKNDDTAQEFDDQNGYKFTIRNITPYPVSTVQTDLDDYVIEMKIEKD